PKVIANPQSVRIEAAATFEPLVDAARHRQLLAKLEERSGTQRGKPRSHNPSTNPLGSRVFDMVCGWPMYRQPYNQRFRYLCGLYQQSHGAECKHNCIDGLLATRFLLSCLRQRILAPSLRAKLVQKLRAIAERELSSQSAEESFARTRAALAEVRK